MFRNLKNLLAGTAPSNRKNRLRHRRPSSHRPRLEQLEARLLLTGSTSDLVSALPVTHFESESDAILLATSPEPGAVLPLSSIPRLNSNPDAVAQLFLDFDGNFEESWRNYRDITSPAFSLNEDPTTFTAWELATIEEVWARVAEDFAPFNINVTTVEPEDFADGHAIHVVIGGSPYDWFGSAAGGISSTGGFHNAGPNTVFVFTDYQWPRRERAAGIADTVSHEAGHAFGLDHQQQFDADGNFVNCYRRGDDHAGPIMGSTEVSERSVWVLGPSASATDIVDEMAVLAGSENGFGYRPDDHGNTADTASWLTRQGAQWTGEGIIAQTADSDAFRFHADAGTAVFTISPSLLGANLIVAAELQTADGERIASGVGTEVGPAVLQANLPEGEYIIVVQSNGEYGSVGQYSIQGSVTGETGLPPLNPTSPRASSEYGYRHSFEWESVRDAVGYRVYRRAGAEEVLVETLPAGITSTVVVVPRFPFQSLTGNWNGEYRVEAFNAAGAASTAWQRVQHQYALPDVGGLQVRATSDTSVELTWNIDVRSETQRLAVMQYTAPRTFFYERFAWLAADQARLTLNDLIPGQRYAFAISGVTPAGLRGGTIDFTMPLTTAPSSPTELTATSQTPTSAELTWQDSEREDGYRIYRLDGEQRVLIGTAESNATRFTVSGLTPRTEYRFVVEAYNADGAAASTSPAVTPVASDEHGDTRQTATPLTAPASLSSSIDHAGDLDMFSIRVEAGTTYVFSTTLGNQATSLRDSVIELFDAEGRRLGINDDFGGTLASRLAWTAPASLDGQSVYLQVRGYSRTQSGDYGLNIEVARPIADDHGNSITTASALSGPTSLNASIERGGDIDMFSLRVVGGTTYTFSTTLGNSAGSLRDSVIELFDAQGSRLGINDDFGGTLASRLSWTAPAEFDGQRIYLGVRAYSRAQTGTYALNVTTAIPVPATPDVTTPSVTIGSHTIGNIATAGSTNQFRLDVTAGQRVEVLTQLLTLRDSTITVTNSRGQRLAYNDDDAGTLASRVELTATQTETWIIAVRGYAAYQTGSYRLLVRSR